jgi:4-amino-4-deoxy-L-arabinose transferase-like glycosyltransferase
MPWLAALIAVMVLAVGFRIGFAIDPQRPQEPDSIGYARIAKNVADGNGFQEGGIRAHLQEPSNYSPGLPLLVAGVYELSGGPHIELARIVLALLGSLAVLFAFLLGSRLAGPAAGLIGAVVVAGYPALLQYQGMLMTEPLAVTLVAGSLLAFLWAADRRGPWAWALAGVLLGLLALVRPDYLPFGLLFAIMALFRVRARAGAWIPGLAAGAVLLAAFLLPIVPWTIRNATVLHRFVPVSTGGGKALYVGTYMPADGDGPALRDQLLATNPDLARQLARAPREARLDTLLTVLAARQHPGVSTDVALTRMGRANLDDDVSDDPLGFAGMLGRKAYRAWREGPRPIMHSTLWKAAQKILALLALAGLLVLALRRRWESIPVALLLLGVSANAALLIASPRRTIVLLPIVGGLAGTAVAAALARMRSEAT